MRLLLVEDDQSLATLLTRTLRQHHHVVEWVETSELGWTYADAGVYDLIILDIQLPQLDGLSLCRQLRAQGYEYPILILTSLESPTDKIRGLDAGADDYIVKPCNLEEFLARVRALLRRGGAVVAPVLQWGDLMLDPTSCQVSYQQHPISLTPKEYGLLELFLRHGGRVFSLSAILAQLWSVEESPGEETVRVHVRGLRQKLKKAGVEPQIIETVYGLGYRLGPPPDPRSESVAIQPRTDPSLARSTLSLTSPQSQQVLQVLASTWQQFQPETLEQVQHLRTRLQQPEGLDPSELVEWRRQVHQLKGLLGTYGLPSGSTTAKRLEVLLQSFPLSAGQLRRAVLLSQILEQIVAGSSQWPPQHQAQLLVISTSSTLNDQLEQWLEGYPLNLIPCVEPQPSLLEPQGYLSDMVLVDMENLGEPGVEVCRQLLSDPQWQGVPLIALVEQTQVSLLEKLLSIDVTDFIYTPLQRLECVTRILLRLGHPLLTQSLS